MFNYDEERKQFEKFVDLEVCERKGIDVDLAKKVVGNIPLLMVLTGNKYDTLQGMLSEKEIVVAYLRWCGVEVEEAAE